MQVFRGNNGVEGDPRGEFSTLEPFGSTRWIVYRLRLRREGGCSLSPIEDLDNTPRLHTLEGL